MNIDNMGKAGVETESTATRTAGGLDLSDAGQRQNHPVRNAELATGCETPGLLQESNVKQPRLLIVHQGALGDVVLTFPALQRLRKRFSRIHIICQGNLGRLAGELVLVDKWFPLESAFFASLYSGSVDPEVKKMLGAYRDILLFSFSEDLRKRVDHIATGKVHLIPPRPEASLRIHIVDHFFSNLMRCRLLKEGEPDAGYSLSAIRHTDKRNRNYDPVRILIHPGSGSRKKCWSLANFIEIAEKLQSNGLTPQFILGPAEHFLTEALQGRNARPVKINRIDHLTDLVSLLKTGGGFIGNDSGVSHLAAFLGLPVVAVFGPSDPERWRPLGRSVSVVSPRRLDCRPCFETAHEDCEDTACLETILPETVLDEFYRIL